MVQKREALKGKLQERFVNDIDHTISENSSMGFTLISQNNSGTRFDWGSGEFYEELLDPKGARFDNLKTMFMDHDRSVKSAIGRVDGVGINGNTLKGTVTFGSGEVEQSIFRKYKEGIIDSVSIGYQINDYDVKSRENDIDLVTVTDYNIFELSAVGIPFDKDAVADRSIVLDDEEEILARVEKLERRFGISNKESK